MFHYQHENVNRKKRVDNMSGYIGVSYSTTHMKYQATVCYKYKQKHLGLFDHPVDAAMARDQFIIDNDLPHDLQILTRRENG